MAKARFTADFEDGHATRHHNLRPLRVVVARADAAKGLGDPELPFTDMKAAPSSTDVWLQIWHLGRRDEAQAGASDYIKAMRGQPAKDVMLAEVPGCIHEVAPDTFAFLASGPPQPGPDLASGSVGMLTLDLRGTDQKPLLVQGKSPRVRLSADGADDLLVLAARLVDSPGKAGPPPAPRAFPLWNLQHAVGSMLAESPPGLTLGFHVVIHDKQGNPVPANTNDGSFFRYGEWVARMFHAIAATSDGELTLNTMPFTSAQDILDGIVKVLGRVRTFIGSTPKVKRLLIFTHGDNNPKYFAASSGGIMLKDEGTFLSGTALPAFVAQLEPFLTPDVVVSLCACHTGASPQHVDDFLKFTDVAAKPADWPAKIPHDLRGRGSFADELRKLLAAKLPDAAVWAHTSRGDALRNSQLRAFTKAGNADISWLALGLPKDLQDAGRIGWKWANRFPNGSVDSSTAFWEFIAMTLQNPTTLVEELYK
jgi:hypothetical protein